MGLGFPSLPQVVRFFSAMPLAKACTPVTLNALGAKRRRRPWT